MKRPSGNSFVIAIILFVAAPGWAQPKTRINWTAVTGAQSGMFMAQQEGLFKKNGLDVELIHIPSSSRGIQAILAGEIGFLRELEVLLNQRGNPREQRSHARRRLKRVTVFGYPAPPACFT